LRSVRARFLDVPRERQFVGFDAYQQVIDSGVDVVLLDMRMPVLDGIGALKEITADPKLAGLRVIMLTTFELDEYVFEALQAGAAGFLIKDTEPADMLRAIRLVAAGESLLSPSVTRRVIESFASRSPILPEPSRPDRNSLWRKNGMRKSVNTKVRLLLDALTVTHARLCVSRRWSGSRHLRSELS
jgi:DNA-binding NarL/FixJ family response regulator